MTGKFVLHHYAPSEAPQWGALFPGKSQLAMWRVHKYPGQLFVCEPMDKLNQAADDALVTLTPDQRTKLEHHIARCEGAADALRVLAGRPYISAEQVSVILAEAGELFKKDIEPLRTALRDGVFVPELANDDRGV